MSETEKTIEPIAELTEIKKINQIKSTEKNEPVAVEYDLSKFVPKQILQNNTRNKSIIILGHFPVISETDRAIVILEKQAFRECEVFSENTSETKTSDNVSEANSSNGDVTKQPTDLSLDSKSLSSTTSFPLPMTYFCPELKIHTEFINNIYGNFRCTPPNDLNSVKAVVIYPATDKHVEKYSTRNKYIFNETAELYRKLTLPYITNSQFSLEWVYNILDHKQETDRIVFEDPDPENGFVLLPDLKWDGSTLETLYLLVIVHRRDVKSLRDLDGEIHLPLLKNIRDQTKRVLQERHQLTGEQLRMYIHYQPSFYHLHIHVNLTRNEAPGIWCEKAHLLDSVINNLEIMSDYYRKASISFAALEGTGFFELYNKVNKIEHSNVDNMDGTQKRSIDKDFEENEIIMTKRFKKEDNEVTSKVESAI